MTNTSTDGSRQLDIALGSVASQFRRRIVKKYVELRSALADGNFDAAGIRAGIFAETVLRFLQLQLTTSYTPFGEKIKNFANECRRLENLPRTAGIESLRVLMPRALLVMYTLRNKRGIGHVGGDVDANEIDAATCARLADWCLCELIRVFHKLSLEEAQAILDTISVRRLPALWTVAGKRRVLDPTLDSASQVLLLLHGETEPGTPAEDLCEWVEYSRLASFKGNVLRRLHERRLVEWDRESDTVTISPLGITRVEEEILPRVRDNLSGR